MVKGLEVCVRTCRTGYVKVKHDLTTYSTLDTPVAGETVGKVVYLVG